MHALTFLCAEIKQDSTQIGKKPSDGNRPPDTGQSYGRNWGKKVSEKYSGSQRNNGQNYRDDGLSEAPEQTIEEKQTSNTTVTGSFDPEILDTNRDNLYFISFYKQKH